MSAPWLSWKLFAAAMVLIGGVLPGGAAQGGTGRGWCNSVVSLPSAHCRGAAPRLRDKVPSRPLMAVGRSRRRARRRELEPFVPCSGQLVSSPGR
ncbi:hypothetical protein EV138_0667 [Kribbella voronezhensis]|uniref:Uncharacterized protein n=1 Tax=Kribbella voronezhensis TaxID=2512212 RepID=A0A4R7T6C8_9ACTN|nr:hypothetical protein EV138_0667 [Kribbella voronezhensis]